MTNQAIAITLGTLGLIFSALGWIQGMRAARKGDERDARDLQEARERAAAISQWGGDIEWLERHVAAAEPPAVTRARYELMEKARLGQ